MIPQLRVLPSRFFMGLLKVLGVVTKPRHNCPFRLQYILLCTQSDNYYILLFLFFFHVIVGN